MQKTEAMALFEEIRAREVDSQNPIEVKVRKGIQEMFSGMFRVYWERCFEKKLSQQLEVPHELDPVQGMSYLLKNFLKERSAEWSALEEKCRAYGKSEEAQKELWKIDEISRQAQVLSHLAKEKYGYCIDL